MLLIDLTRTFLNVHSTDDRQRSVFQKDRGAVLQMSRAVQSVLPLRLYLSPLQRLANAVYRKHFFPDVLKMVVVVRSFIFPKKFDVLS